MTGTPSPTWPERDTTRRDVALVSCMRNEGLFILEWAAYHSLMGFSDIVVFTNDCTDGSDLLLDRLAELGYLTHVRHSPPPGSNPQEAAMQLAFRHPRVLANEWLLHIDADEFLFVTTGDGTVRALLEVVDLADVVAISWKCFGNAGKTRWDGGNVLEEFTWSQGRPMRRISFHKSLFRHRMFDYGTDHMPKGPKRADIRVVSTTGKPIDPTPLHQPRKSRYLMDFRNVTFRNAAIYHYAIKSDDLYVMKNDRGDGQGRTHTKYYIHSDAYRRHNRNESEDRSILERWPAVAGRLQELRSDPLLARLETACIQAFQARRDAILTPEQLAAWSFPPPSAQPEEREGEEG